MDKSAIFQTLRTNLFLFVWLFLVVFFVASMFAAYWMGWTDERLVVLLAGAIGASLQSIAMLTNTAVKGGHRLSDLGKGGTLDSTTTTTLVSETKSEEITIEPDPKPPAPREGRQN